LPATELYGLGADDWSNPGSHKPSLLKDMLISFNNEITY
jgi:hypothetical protein